MQTPLLTLITFIPVLGAAVLLFFNNRHDKLIKCFAIAVTLCSFVLSLVVYQGFDPKTAGMQFEEIQQWIPSLGITYYLGIDGLSMPMVLLTTLITLLAVIASWNITDRPKTYFIAMLVLETGMIGVFCALDLLLFFIFFESVLVPMYFLIGIWGGHRKDYAALKFIIYTGAGSAVMLITFIAMYFVGGALTGVYTFDVLQLTGVAYPTGFAFVAFIALFVSFAVKLPVFPFHTWLPDAHVEAPTAASMILAGILLKMGAYGLIRIGVAVFPQAAQSLAGALAILAVINIVYGAFLALAQTDLKKMVAYSSISHMGYVLLGVASLNVVGFTGACLQMFNHGTITALLFLMVGLIYERTHTRDIGEMGGLAVKIPVLGSVLVIGSLASLGLPGLSGFVSELLIFLGGFRVFQLHTAVAATGIVLTAFYLLRMLQRVMFGPLYRNEPIEDARPLEYVPMVALVLVIIWLGINPESFNSLTLTTLQQLIGRLGGI